MDAEPQPIDIPVAGGPLRVNRWGTGDRVVLAAHGITGSSMSWRPIARHLDDDWTLLAPDLRGRGESRDMPGPVGLDTHADDLLAVADHLGVERAVLAGHSMGGFVVALAAARAPELTERVVLVDGGLPFTEPGVDVTDETADTVLETTLGPALARLRRTFAGPDDYLDFWRNHPAFSEWSDDIDRYIRYDLTGEPGTMRSKVSEVAVRADGRDLLLANDTVGAALRAIARPVTLVRAPRGLLDEPGGLQPDAVVKRWRDTIADLNVVTVEDTNHYSIQFGAAGAAVIAAHIAGAG
jgi:pimeloyl-ACP methyl ester carboxylesterase